MTEETSMNISDSVFMGDVQQNILNIGECPSCSASNVKVMKCQDKQCTSKKFCELCHPDCRYSAGSLLRFDSGAGSGPFCSLCLQAKITQFLLEKQERKREKKERKREKQERKRINARKINEEGRITRAITRAKNEGGELVKLQALETRRWELKKPITKLVIVLYILIVIFTFLLVAASMLATVYRWSIG